MWQVGAKLRDAEDIDFDLAVIVIMVLVFSYTKPIHAVLFTQATRYHVHDDDGNPTKVYDENSRQQLEFTFCIPDQVNNDETYYCTIAEYLRLTDWCCTHYEATVRYGQGACMQIIREMSLEVPVAQTAVMSRRGQQPENICVFEKHEKDNPLTVQRIIEEARKQHGREVQDFEWRFLTVRGKDNKQLHKSMVLTD